MTFLSKELYRIVLEYAYPFQACSVCKKQGPLAPDKFTTALFNEFICRPCADIPRDKRPHMPDKCCRELCLCIVCGRYINAHMAAQGRTRIACICQDCELDLATLRGHLRHGKPFFNSTTHFPE